MYSTALATFQLFMLQQCLFLKFNTSLKIKPKPFLSVTSCKRVLLCLHVKCFHLNHYLRLKEEVLLLHFANSYVLSLSELFECRTFTCNGILLHCSLFYDIYIYNLSKWFEYHFHHCMWSQVMLHHMPKYLVMFHFLYFQPDLRLMWTQIVERKTNYFRDKSPGRKRY